MTPFKVFFTLTSILFLQIIHGSSDYVTIELNTVNNSKCGDENGWRSVNLDTLSITSTRYSNNKVLKASFFSCASFPVNVSPSAFIISVYVEALYDSRIEILVHDNDKSILNNFVYDKSNVDFEQGWHTITLPIDKETTAYVTLLGFSQEEDIVIVESIKYNTLINSKTDWTHEIEEVKIIELLIPKNENDRVTNLYDDRRQNLVDDDLYLGTTQDNFYDVGLLELRQDHNSLIGKDFHLGTTPDYFYDGGLLDKDLRLSTTPENLYDDMRQNLIDDTYLGVYQNSESLFDEDRRLSELLKKNVTKRKIYQNQNIEIMSYNTDHKEIGINQNEDIHDLLEKDSEETNIIVDRINVQNKKNCVGQVEETDDEVKDSKVIKQSDAEQVIADSENNEIEEEENNGDEGENGDENGNADEDTEIEDEDNEVEGEENGSNGEENGGEDDENGDDSDNEDENTEIEEEDNEIEGGESGDNGEKNETEEEENGGANENEDGDTETEEGENEIEGEENGGNGEENGGEEEENDNEDEDNGSQEEDNEVEGGENGDNGEENETEEEENGGANENEDGDTETEEGENEIEGGENGGNGEENGGEEEENDNEDGGNEIEEENENEEEDNGSDGQENGGGEENGGETEDNNSGGENNGSESGNESDNNSSFWNIWTITLVSVASCTLTAMVVVSAYYIGKHSGHKVISPIDLSDLEAPRIIPRAKTTRPPYERFGSEYGGSGL